MLGKGNSLLPGRPGATAQLRTPAGGLPVGNRKLESLLKGSVTTTGCCWLECVSGPWESPLSPDQRSALGSESFLCIRTQGVLQRAHPLGF